LFLAGCWDEVEVEDLAFVAAVAIDLAEEQEGQMMFEMTEQLVVPAGLNSITQSGEGKAYRNLSETGESIYLINRKLSRQEDREINIEHLGLVIVSAELAKEEGMLANVLDVFVRQQYMRRGILLAIADGKAKDLLTVEPEHINIPAEYIMDLLQNRGSLVTAEPMLFGEVQQALLANRSYKIPQLSMDPDSSISYDSLAVIAEPQSKLVDTLGPDMVKGLHFIVGENLSGTISTELEGDVVSFEIREGRSKVRLLNDDKNGLVFQVDMDIKGDLMEYFGTVDFYKEENLKRFEKLFEGRILELANLSVTHIKDELGVDVLDFGNYLRIHHHGLWEEVMDDWDHGENYFSQSEILLNVNATIAEPGTSVKVNDEQEE
jgi:spore germination protein